MSLSRCVAPLAKSTHPRTARTPIYGGVHRGLYNARRCALQSATVPNTVEKLLLAAPRGYCAGVDRAVQTVERALDLHGPPVYVRKEIVHNKHVVEQLRERGAVFVEDRPRCPRGPSPCSPRTASRRAYARERRRAACETIDATCPLVTKVHREAVRFAEDGYTIVLVGHDGHEEVRRHDGGGPRADRARAVRGGRRRRSQVEDPERVAYITQTTLSVDETSAIVARLRERFPAIVGPRTDDICYATTNRQAAVKQIAGGCD